MRVARHRACNPLLQTDHRLVAQVFFGALTAVVVIGPGQSHSHGCKGGFERHKGMQDPGEQPQKKGKTIHECVWEVEAWGGVSQAHQNFRHEVPEADWLIIGDVIRLQEREEGTEIKVSGEPIKTMKLKREVEGHQ